MMSSIRLRRTLISARAILEIWTARVGLHVADIARLTMNF
jgi:hypothetical protein